MQERRGWIQATSEWRNHLHSIFPDTLMPAWEAFEQIFRSSHFSTRDKSSTVAAAQETQGKIISDSLLLNLKLISHGLCGLIRAVGMWPEVDRHFCKQTRLHVHLFTAKCSLKSVDMTINPHGPISLKEPRSIRFWMMKKTVLTSRQHVSTYQHLLTGKVMFYTEPSLHSSTIFKKRLFLSLTIHCY